MYLCFSNSNMINLTFPEFFGKAPDFGFRPNLIQNFGNRHTKMSRERISYLINVKSSMKMLLLDPLLTHYL